MRTWRGAEVQSLTSVEHPDEPFGVIKRRFLELWRLRAAEYDALHVVTDNGVPFANVTRTEQLASLRWLNMSPVDVRVSSEYRQKRFQLERVTTGHYEHFQGFNSQITHAFTLLRTDLPALLTLEISVIDIHSRYLAAHADPDSSHSSMLQRASHGSPFVSPQWHRINSGLNLPLSASSNHYALYLIPSAVEVR